MTLSKIKMVFLSIVILTMCSITLNAQLTQKIRGTIVDLVLQRPIAGATIVANNLNRSAISDTNGNFMFRGVPVGSIQLRISHVGFQDAVMDNIIVNAGKETVLTISLDAAIHTEKEIVVKANSRKNRPLNEMSVISARAFSAEETQKYAAAVNDPLRMATGFAGVAAPNDGNNDIVIRGNSPTGLLWRMEGVDIPNPNHFSSPASSGGGISILSAQLLSNSDFLTGAFPAEYGDALSGVFDLHLRKGNNERNEYTMQAGLLGLDASAEGPFNHSYKGSFLINYRYSTLALLDKIGINVTSGATNFQDLSYHIYLPTRRAGIFGLFGFGGLSSQTIQPKLDSSKWKTEGDRYGQGFISNTGVGGMTHSIFLGEKTNLRSTLALSFNEIREDENYTENNYTLSKLFRSDYKTPKWTLSSTLNHQFNTKTMLRAGTIINFIGFNYYHLAKANLNAPLKEVINTSGQTQTLQAFAEWRERLADKFLFNIGVHYLELLYNHSYAVEPRASLKWELNYKSSIAVGYGLHSQIQALGVYFAQNQDVNGKWLYPNSSLGLTKAQHFVFSYNQQLTKDLRLKTEFYYQQLFNVPVNANDSNTFSTLNIESSDYISDPLVNKGKGRNYGFEITLEKYLSNNLYYIINSSFYESKYTALDGIERNTRFNGNYLFNSVAGKDFVFTGHVNKTKTLGINIKMIYIGGLRTTPIDIAKSTEAGYSIYNQIEAYSQQNPPYFRTDIRVSLKQNRNHHTSTLSLDIQNITNRQNVYDQNYDNIKKQIVYDYQAGLIPVLNYKIEF
jgi:hypothetical protein